MASYTVLSKPLIFYPQNPSGTGEYIQEFFAESWTYHWKLNDSRARLSSMEALSYMKFDALLQKEIGIKNIIFYTNVNDK